jgi:cytochrome c5
MQKKWIPLPILAALALVTTLTISSWTSPGTIVPLQQSTPTSPFMEMPPTEDSWIIVDLPADATQLEYGTEVYRLVCKACHGDRGQGLTDDWRAQWAPKDQNCWQSKCHASNHPPDGFYMPQVPAVLGQPVRGFGTALNLYTYNHQFMPWHDRGSMTEKESWSVTAYILKINGIEPPAELNAENAANIDLSVIDPNLYPTPVPSTPEPQAQLMPENTAFPVSTQEQVHENQTGDGMSLPWIITVVVAILVGLLVLWHTLRPKQIQP